MSCINHPEVAEGVRYCSRCGRGVCADCYITLHDLTLCAACKHEQLLDVGSGAAKGSVTDFATIGRRWAAMFIDKFIMVVLIFGLGMLGTLFDHDRDITFALTGAFLGLVIFVAYETLTTRGNGQTWGKRMLKIRVIGRSGNAVSGGQAFGRAIARTAAVHVLAIIDYLPVFFTKEKTCLHDMIAGTRVVNAE